jgi:hypothetical protein
MAEDDELDREAILARRKRFIATALAGLALTVAGCPEPCLTLVSDAVPPDADADVIDASDATLEAGPDAADAGGDARDATLHEGDAMPCLSPLPPDGG